QRALPAVEQQRRVSIDEELVEGDSGWWSSIGQEGREPINSIRDFVDAGFHVDLPPPGGFHILSVCSLRSAARSGQERRGTSDTILVQKLNGAARVLKALHGITRSACCRRTRKSAPSRHARESVAA